VDPSFQGEFNLDQIIVSRIRASIQNLANAKQQVERQGIKGDTYDNLKKLLCEIVEIVEVDIEDILDEIAQISREDIKIHRSDRIHRVLEEFLYLVDTIQTTTSQTPLELYYLARVTLCGLGHEDIKVVLISGASLGTTNLADGLKNLFSGFFNQVLTYIDSHFPFYWIIYVPPSLVRAPLSWPLIAHEIGHVLERQEWKVVNKHYPYPTVSSPTRQPYIESDVKSRYAQEFQADFVALSYFGPIFAHRLLAIYYTRELVISPTHPSWSERFAALAGKLEEMGFLAEATKLRQVGGEEAPLISRERIEHLDDIFSETAGLLSGAGCLYTRDAAKEKKAQSRLARFSPYTDDMRTLLNVADVVIESMLQSTDGLAKKRELESEFDYLLLDSIRLTYIKQTSQPAFS